MNQSDEKKIFDEVEFYVWIEQSDTVRELLERRYGVHADPRTALDSDTELAHFQPVTPMEGLVVVTLMGAEPSGYHLGETWGDLPAASVWEKIFEFQRACSRTCLLFTGSGLPPADVTEFLKRAAEIDVDDLISP